MLMKRAGAFSTAFPSADDINAPVQCIVSLPQFAEDVLSMAPAQGPAGDIHRGLQRLIPQLLGTSGERELSGDRLKAGSSL
eukprot:tig00000912_g5413.t1